MHPSLQGMGMVIYLTIGRLGEALRLLLYHPAGTLPQFVLVAWWFPLCVMQGGLEHHTLCTFPTAL